MEVRLESFEVLVRTDPISKATVKNISLIFKCMRRLRFAERGKEQPLEIIRINPWMDVGYRKSFTSVPQNHSIVKGAAKKPHSICGQKHNVFA